jgi:glucose-1-phosphate thymidylyltransferase
VKGIVLSGGAGTRLYPLTSATSKQLLPVYDKPMIYYAIGTLMLAGIREILIISTPQDVPRFEALLGDGRRWGVSFSYRPQPSPDGIAQSFLIGKDFVGKDSVALILGDNIFYGPGFRQKLLSAARAPDGATVFGYYVKDPERYGVAETDADGRVVSIEEKPKQPRSHCAITGLYFYDNDVVRIAEGLRPSARGELEITDVNVAYMKAGKLRLELLGRGFAWLDAGTPESLMESSHFVATIEKRQGLKVGVPEEIAYRMGFISRPELQAVIEKLPKGDYASYLTALLDAGV